MRVIFSSSGSQILVLLVLNGLSLLDELLLSWVVEEVELVGSLVENMNSNEALQDHNNQMACDDVVA